MLQKNKSIGVIDSGLGGLSLFRYISGELPHENIVYLADSANVPYGDKDSAWVLSRSKDLIATLIHQADCKVVVIACNTITAVAIDQLRVSFDIPIIAIEPAIKPAVNLTTSKQIAVLATALTLKGDNVSRLVVEYGEGIEILLIPCIGLADRVESGQVNSSEMRVYLTTLLEPLMAAQVDTVVLGCTHYPFVQHTIQDIMGAGVTIIDPSEAVTAQLIRQLNYHDLNSILGTYGSREVWTNIAEATTESIVFSLLGKTLPVVSFEITAFDSRQAISH